jgi:hypothetical protein
MLEKIFIALDQADVLHLAQVFRSDLSKDPLLRSCCLYTFCEHAFVSKFPNDFCTSQIGAIEKGLLANQI